MTGKRLLGLVALTLAMLSLWMYCTRGTRLRFHRMSLERLREEAGRRVDDPQVYLLLGQRLRQKEDLADAAQAITHAYNLQSDDPAIAAAMAAVWLDENNVEAADHLLSQAAHTWPRSSQVVAQLSNLDMKRGRYAEALQKSRRAVRLGPSLSESWHALGRAAGANKLTDEALSAYDRALALAPEDAEITADYGEFLSKSGRVAAATAMLRRSVTLAPRSPRPKGLLGAHLGAYAREENERREAIAYLQQAIAIAPMASDPRYHLGLVLVRDGRPLEAIPPLRACVEIDPSLVEARLALAQAHAAAGHSQEAKWEFDLFEQISAFRREAAHLEVRLRRRPKQRDLLLRMARLHEQHGWLDRALRYYRRALEVGDDDAALRRHVEVLERRR